jgi:hypothetical protein
MDEPRFASKPASCDAAIVFVVVLVVFVVVSVAASIIEAAATFHLVDNRQQFHGPSIASSGHHRRISGMLFGGSGGARGILLDPSQRLKPRNFQVLN